MTLVEKAINRLVLRQYNNMEMATDFLDGGKRKEILPYVSWTGKCLSYNSLGGLCRGAEGATDQCNRCICYEEKLNVIQEEAR